MAEVRSRPTSGWKVYKDIVHYSLVLYGTVQVGVESTVVSGRYRMRHRVGAQGKVQQKVLNISKRSKQCYYN